ncbi:RNA 2',3'-cyclic phosphodiesterase [Dictyobacter alpinus]|uniref:RNA 2',3'-cyclic phosphodiesterase n=1 Tax=Dictyobacter alpinus TaxID=2014873 RepID=A0A402B9A8_9CHLR|nr:RNA 2',3'-cyclic phosphodiesterase [Dictyobacter alpinus]GCE27961.1 RNA 2',3'-cyclic phosphodiesterase [Dictyobacter alpinus]
MTRTFIALEMNAVLQSHLSGFIHQVAPVLPGMKWVNPQGIHLTLAFLGELDDEQLADVSAAAQETAWQASSFTYHLTRPGIFGPPRQPRVLWMGIEENSGSLVQVHRFLQQQLSQRNFSLDTRPFSPHLTLARGKMPLTPQEYASLQKLLARPQPSAQTYPATYLHVMKSELTSTGAHYTELQKYSFK